MVQMHYPALNFTIFLSLIPCGALLLKPAGINRFTSPFNRPSRRFSALDSTDSGSLDVFDSTPSLLRANRPPTTFSTRDQSDRGLLSRLKSSWKALQTSSLNELKQNIFAECDGDSDGFIDRRELLALLARLDISIPQKIGIEKLFVKYDVDESGKLDFYTFCTVLDDLQAFTGSGGTLSKLGSTRRWLKERRMKKNILWRNIFDTFDTMPSNGYLDRSELAQALLRAGVPVTYELLERQMIKYDADNNGMLSFQEFRRMATDLFSSSLLFESALSDAETRLRPYEEANAIAEDANKQAREYIIETGNDVQDISAEDATAAIVSTLEKRISSSTFKEAVNVLNAQDNLFRRFKARYDMTACGVDQLGCEWSTNKIELHDFLTAERVQLLDVLKTGDIASIRALTNMDWNFVYPPAVINRTTGERILEGWCRSPLCLLIRPDEGNFEAGMLGVMDKERHELIEDVLASGCADPNFPPVYWGGPALHAAFEGDVQALEALRSAGCDLQQRYEWLTQNTSRFTLVHAAAFNGQINVLRYLQQYLPPSMFREVDSQGSNALHTLLESSRDVESAQFLLDIGVDGFALDDLSRSPLSMAIEVLPEFARVLLDAKSRFEYRWWGNELYWFSFSGIVLPLTTKQVDPEEVPEKNWLEQAVAGGGNSLQLLEGLRSNDGKEKDPSAEGGGGGRGGGQAGYTTHYFPLQVRDLNGDLTTIEDLIVRHGRKQLLDTPVILDLIERKWFYFAKDAYRRRIITFVAMLFSIFVISAFDPETPLFYTAIASISVSYPTFVSEEVKQIKNTIRAFSPQKTLTQNIIEKFEIFDLLDLYIIAIVPVIVFFRIPFTAGVDVDGLMNLPDGADAFLASLAGTLQVAVAISLLNLVAVFRVLGPLLITVVQMVSDGLRFALIILVVLLGYTNGFYALLHFDSSSEELAAIDFDYSYTSIITELSLYLTGQPNLDLIKPLSPVMQVGGAVLFWTFIITAYFVLLNLLIAIFNTTYERIQRNSITEWLFVRLQATIMFDRDMSRDGVIEYYKQLEDRNSQRVVRDVVGIDDSIR